MAELTSLRNIGTQIEKELKSVEICSAEDLIQMGSKEAFLRLRLKYPDMCLMHLYSLQGAIENIPHNKLSDEVKADLKSFHNNLK